jgi:DNA adenine methylase
MKTPITYWGGKQQLTAKILSLMPPHERYNEPFFGGGAIFLQNNPLK